MLSNPASGCKSGILSPGLAISAIRFAQARPKTTISNKEFAPNRLAPCTDADAASPAANRPGTTKSSTQFPSLSNDELITSPK